MEFTNGEFKVSTEPGLLDIDYVWRKLNETYWAQGRPLEMVKRGVEHSLCFGLYGSEPREQLGFARVVTDQATFSWICDVFVDERVRGKGLGKWLMQCVISHPDVKERNAMLATRDAHGLYERYGFVRREVMRRPADPAPQGKP